MKYEISNILNDKNKYVLTISRMHKKVDKGILFFLLMKISISDSMIIHILYIFISSMGLLILSSDFIPNYNKYYCLSTCLRILTPFSFVEKIQLTHFSYIIICSIIFIICFFRLIYIYYFNYKVNHLHITKVYNIKINSIINILNHMTYIFFSYIIEFLSFIYYIETFPNNFVIKKDKKINEITNRFIFALNTIFILIYNYNNYLFIFLINQPTADKLFPVRTTIPSSKIYILIIFQNFGMIHPLQFYLEEKNNKLWSIIYILAIFLLLLWVYLITIKIYNYDNCFNLLISFIGEFSFSSVIIEFFLFIFSIRYENYKELICFTFIKLLLNISLYYFINKIYQKIMMKKIKKRLFKNNSNNLTFDKSICTSIHFLKEIIEQKDMKLLNILNDFMIEHKICCLNNNCGCKIIEINEHIKKRQNIFFVDDLIKKVIYYIETILIKFNYQKNYELSIILSEHFFSLKNNPVMSYSILQTLLHNNYKMLSKREIIIIYESMNKYIKYCLNSKIKELNHEKYLNNNFIINKALKENDTNQYINLILKIKKSIKYMVYYSTKFINIIKHKDNYENSTIIEISETFNDIKSINSPYLNRNILDKIIRFLIREIEYTTDIQKFLFDLEEYNKFLSYEFLYKLFLFVDLFWNGIIPDKLFKIFYSFSQNKNLFNSHINPEIYLFLEEKHNKLMITGKRKYYLLFKYTKDMKISYISESLIQKLKYKKTNIINHEIDSILIKELSISHENAVKYYFILSNNYVLKDKIKFIFDSKGYMIKSKMNSTLQIGINKNILIICILEIEQRNKQISFYLNKNLNIISINQNFRNKLHFTLPLISEFKIQLKDLFGIELNDIAKNFKKKIKIIKDIKEYKFIDTKEFILKNLFKSQNQNNHYKINNKYFIDEDIEKNDIISNEEERMIKKTIKVKNSPIFNDLFNNKCSKTLKFNSAIYKIEKYNFLLNFRKIFEKINSYEQDKLERKNIYKDYLQLIHYYNALIKKNNFYFVIYIQPRLIYDSIFFLCTIENYISQIKDFPKYEFGIMKTETEENNSNFNNSKLKNNEKLAIEKTNDLKSNIEQIKFYEDNKSNYFFEKIKINRTSKLRLCSLLLINIFILLIGCIITLNYQTSLAQKDDKIFDALYYNYFQRTQFIYLNSIVLSIFYELLNISEQNILEDNKEVLKIIGYNIQNSHELFKKYYIDFKMQINEDFSLLFSPLQSNKITVNWENKLFINSYDSEMALIVARILDSVNHKFNENDIFDCKQLLLERYLTINRTTTPVYGNFIKLVYYFYINYDAALRMYFINLENSFDRSLKNYSRQTKIIYIILEGIGIVCFFSFFYININFLIQSNKYIFQSILFMFIDFKQTESYSFNNKENNLSAIQRITNYILLLNEFTNKNLNSLKINKETKNIINLKEILDNKKQDSFIIKNKKIKDNKTKPISKKYFLVNRKKSDESIKNSSIFNFHSLNSFNKSNKDIKEGLKILNDDNLNKKELINNIPNNSNNHFNNISKHNSTSLFLNTSNNNNSSLIDFFKSDLPDNSQNNLDNQNIFNDLKLYKEDDNIKITIDKILFLTKITTIYSIKLIIIIFIVFTFIFVFYFIGKLIISLIFIFDFQNIIYDFKTLTIQYNHLIYHWNIIKSLFILPNTTISRYDLNNTEKYFFDINNKVYNIYNTRIKKYKKISKLYDILLDPSSTNNITSLDFCLEHKRCHDIIKNLTNCLLINGIVSTVNIYVKEISSYYRLFLLSKKNLNSTKDITNYFVNERYNILSSNINHILIFLEELYFKYFLEDEKTIVDNFHIIIKIINIIEICYCLLLNIFSVFFVYNFINSIIKCVEEATKRINGSISRLKYKNLDNNN